MKLLASFAIVAALGMPAELALDSREVTMERDAAAMLCTESECASQCRSWINNPFCMRRDSYCRADNSCVCIALCILPGQHAHKEMAASCDCVGVDSCQE